MKTGVLLYGHPAAGKDTVTGALEGLSAKYRLFRRIKVGPGRTVGYRSATSAELDQMRREGSVVWENAQYGAIYAVDREGLEVALADSVPVLHVGQAPAIDAIRKAMPEVAWFVVELRCPERVAAERLTERDPSSIRERLAVLRATPVLARCDLRIDTSRTDPADAATQIDRVVRT